MTVMQPRDTDVPLTLNQERLLLAHEISAGGPIIQKSQFALTFRVAVRAGSGALERALNAVLRRHTVFWTTFHRASRYSEQDRLLQLSIFARLGVFIPGLWRQSVVTEPPQLALHESELSPDVDLATAVEAEIARPLEMSAAPLLRATLFTRDGDEQFLVVVCSHLLMDGWAVRLFVRELIAQYEAQVFKRDTELPAVGADAIQFTSWQHAHRRAGGFAADEEFWEQCWTSIGDGIIAHANIPFAISAPARLPVIQVQRTLTPEDATHLKQALRTLRATPYTLFRTATTIALHHLTGKTRLAYWGNFSNRRALAFENTIAWCANTHLVTTSIHKDLSYAQFHAVQVAAVRSAQAHEALPLSGLWQRLGQSLDRHDTRVNFDLLPPRRQRFTGRLLEPMSVPVGVYGIELDIRVREDDATYSLIATFNDGRYRREAVTELLGCIERIVKTMADAPNDPVWGSHRELAVLH